MSTEFNCKTKLIADYETMPYKEAPRRNAITDGISEEGLYYVNKATQRTTENEYRVFDSNGLMPESYDVFEFMISSRMMKICDYGENGEIYTADERFLIEPNYEENTKTVYYDSDGLNGFDRSATYQETSIGNLKIAESFNADGDKTNEVEISRTLHIHEDHYVIKEYENPNHTLLDSFLNIFGLGEPKIKEVKERDPKLSYTTLNVGVNADDLGYDERNGNHFEYMEKVTVFPDSIFEDYTEQKYIEWEHAEKTSHITMTKIKN